jgi:hypothetical protein
MSEPTIPVALDPHGNLVPIEEAIRFKTDYYECPECNHYLSPRKGSKQIHHYAHQRGELGDDTCSLSTQEAVDKIVDDLRTSDIEKDEQAKNIRLFLRMVHDTRVELFGVIPALDWDSISGSTNIDSIIGKISIKSEGVKKQVSPQQFHPTEPEVFLDLDADTEEFLVNVDAPQEVEDIQGAWRAEGIQPGDLFVGDQGRAQRQASNTQVRDGEWAYVVVDDVPESLPDETNVYSIAEYSVLSFPIREETQPLLNQYTEESTRDDYGFDADIVLPPHVHPTAQGPVEGKLGQQAMACITPAESIDPIFEAIPVPRKGAEPDIIDQTGPGNPRYYSEQYPSTPGSKRLSIHQRNSSRHRLVHLHATDSFTHARRENADSNGDIGLRIAFNSQSVFLGPLSGKKSVTVPEEFDPLSLPQSASYMGPEGLEIEITASFEKDSSHGPTVRRTTADLDQKLSDIGHWLTMGCYEVSFQFGNLGSALLEYPEANAEIGAGSAGGGD